MIIFYKNLNIKIDFYIYIINKLYMTNIQENIIKKMDILRKINGPPPPYLKENEICMVFRAAESRGSSWHGRFFLSVQGLC